MYETHGGRTMGRHASFFSFLTRLGGSKNIRAGRLTFSPERVPPPPYCFFAPALFFYSCPPPMFLFSPPPPPPCLTIFTGKSRVQRGSECSRVSLPFSLCLYFWGGEGGVLTGNMCVCVCLPEKAVSLEARGGGFSLAICCNLKKPCRRG